MDTLADQRVMSAPRWLDSRSEKTELVVNETASCVSCQIQTTRVASSNSPRLRHKLVRFGLLPTSLPCARDQSPDAFGLASEYVSCTLSPISLVPIHRLCAVCSRNQLMVTGSSQILRSKSTIMRGHAQNACVHLNASRATFRIHRHAITMLRLHHMTSRQACSPPWSSLSNGACRRVYRSEWHRCRGISVEHVMHADTNQVRYSHFTRYRLIDSLLVYFVSVHLY